MAKFKKGDIVSLKHSVLKGGGNYVTDLEMDLEVTNGYGVSNNTFSGFVCKSNSDNYRIGWDAIGWPNKDFDLKAVQYKIGDLVEITYEGVPGTLFEGTEGISYNSKMASNYPKGTKGILRAKATNAWLIDDWYWPESAFKLVESYSKAKEITSTKFNKGDLVVCINEVDTIIVMVEKQIDNDYFSGMVFKTTTDFIRIGEYSKQFRIDRYELANIALKININAAV